MRSLFEPLSAWTAADVQLLIDQTVDEAQRLEYKQELNLEPRRNRLEACKDVSGMANATGGLLVYGVAERELDDGRRIPTALTPLADGDAQSRLENIIFSAVAPHLNVETRLLPVESDGYVLLVRVHQRAGAPHMVHGYNDNRYYVRRGISTTPMTPQEVEQAFAEVAVSDGRIERMLDSVPHVSGVAGQSGLFNTPAAEVPDPGRAWASLIAVPSRGPDPMVRMSPALRASLRDSASTLLGTPDLSPAAEGYVAAYPDRDSPGRIVQKLGVYRNGILEFGERLSWGIGSSAQDVIATTSDINKLFRQLRFCALVYQSTDYWGPLRLFQTVENAHMAILATPSGWLPPHHTGTPPPHIETWLDTNVEEISTPGGRLLVARHLMDFVWQAYGWERCHMYDQDGALRTDVQGLEAP